MLIIFDWDGTLLDSTGKIVRCMELAFDELGAAAVLPQRIKEIIGLSLPEAIRQLQPALDDAGLQQVQQAYSRHYLEADRQPCAFYPGARETLDELRARGHRLAVATGKSRQGLQRVLNNVGLADFFDATRCADETRSKPHPQMLHELLIELTTDVGDAVMVGDTDFDMAMAQAANMARVAVSHGAHPVERLLPYSPLRVIDALPELLDLSGV